MTDCAACRLFEPESEAADCLHINRPGGMAMTEQALILSHLGQGAKVLDAACGMSSTLNYLRHQSGLDAIGLDISKDMLARGSACYPGLIRIQANGECIPLASVSMDAVLSECALSLTGNVHAALDEFHRLLRPGGKLIITDIYVREVSDPAALDCLASTHCLAGAKSEQTIQKIITDHGFEISHWQDHSLELREWMARMVFKLGSLDDFYRSLASCESGSKAISGALGTKIKLGYYLLVAEKPTGNS